MWRAARRACTEQLPIIPQKIPPFMYMYSSNNCDCRHAHTSTAHPHRGSNVGGPPGTMAGVWTEHKTPEGSVYYFNMKAMQSSWYPNGVEPPRAGPSVAGSAPAQAAAPAAAPIAVDTAQDPNQVRTWRVLSMRGLRLGGVLRWCVPCNGARQLG